MILHNQTLYIIFMIEAIYGNNIITGKPIQVTATIGITDDSPLFNRSVTALINNFDHFSVVLNASNGSELLEKLEANNNHPDIILLDVMMPQLNGIETAKRVSDRYPLIKLVALSQKEDDTTIINMLKAGCCAYLLKDTIHETDLEKALNQIQVLGYYNADAANINYRRLIVHEQKGDAVKLNDREMKFLQLACSDRTYKQIASEMYLSERTIDGYREALFEKLNVQSRVGMAMEAIRKSLVKI